MRQPHNGFKAIRACKMMLEALEGSEKLMNDGDATTAFIVNFVRHREDPTQDSEDLYCLSHFIRLLSTGLTIEGGADIVRTN